VLRKAAWWLPAEAGVAVLRFNTRGTAGSAGEFDGGTGERYDVAAAVEYAEFAGLPRIWLVGWSFGAELALRYGAEPSVTGIILLSPPMRFVTAEELAVWAGNGKPVVALVPEFDDFLRPDEARRRLAGVPQVQVVAVPGAKHLWVGYADTVLEAVTALALGRPLR